MQFHTKYATKIEKWSKYAFICPMKTFPFSSECLESSLNQFENQNNPISKNMTYHRNPPLSYKAHARVRCGTNSRTILYSCIEKNYSIIQSRPNMMRAYRRLSLASFACLLASQRAIRLTLLPNTHSVISVYFPSRWSCASTYICKAETLVFTDCDYCYTLML